MRKPKNETMPITKKQSALPTQKKTFDLMTYEEQKADLIKRALPGKCPVRFIEGDGEKIDYDAALVRSPYESYEDALKALTGTTDFSLAAEIFTDGVNAMPGRDRGRKANIAVQTLADVAPQDATESMLCMQQMALYAQGMEQLNIAKNCTTMSQAEFHSKTAIKLLRLNIETIEALNRHRRGNEQRIVIQHVNVNQGGQAVVCGVSEGGGDAKKK